MSKVDYNIEFAHLYSSDISGDLTKVRRSVERTREIIRSLETAGKTFSLAVLVDDYSPNQKTLSESDVRKVIGSLGLQPDYIFFESDMAVHAEDLLKGLPAKNLVKLGERGVFKSHSTDVNFSDLIKDRRRYKSIFMEKANPRTIPRGNVQKPELLTLKQERVHSMTDLVLYLDEGSRRKYSCPVLAACWYLFRLGIDSFVGRHANLDLGSKLFFGRSIISVLPLDFLKVESTAMELIRLNRNKAIRHCRHRMEYYFFS